MTRTALFKPFEIIDGDRAAGVVLLADHASNRLPDEYGDLGLPPAEFERHIAYDIGVESVTRKLAALTGWPAVMACFSRLLIDPNRGPDDPTLIRQLYDGTVVPGNYPISSAERRKRLEKFYEPYHDAISAMIASVAAAHGAPPVVISIHSFTPFMQGRERPWHVGILWDKDDRVARVLFEELRREPGLVVGDNEPYDGALRGDTMFRHCTVSGFAHALIEIRQDLIVAESGAAEWAERLAPILDGINKRTDMHEVKFFGSRTGPV
ncbi:N-formylglutamate amidohydrolase [Chelativorans sp. Marseille-P2723]|uniref:N-formylglutamate amidohydrolase n=1 Tax=Chelativorans sp. Marseille-P2723 TaxID=2709133 RepID=UPI00157077EC|nr:N-formylglutamate amidohydrolase [Chelativorans sp. Marseille-P2723]